jgi:hypothetical protein
MMRLLLFFLFLYFIFLVSSGLISCKDTQTNPSSEIVFPNDSVSFTRHVGPLFQQKCTGSSCHGGSAPQAGLNLEYTSSYQALMYHNPTLVVPRNTNCLLMERLDGRFLPQMPLPKSPQLNQNQINGVKIWIEEGAQLN